MQSRIIRAVARGLCWVAASGWILPSVALAHEIPNDVTVQAWLRPEGDALRLLLRVPLEAMRDIEWPVRGPGYLEIGEAEPLLPNAVTVWLASDVELYEEGERLPAPVIAAVRLSLPSDRAFRTYETALEHVAAPGLDPATEIVWQQLMLDVLLEYPIESERSVFSIRPGVERLGLRVLTVMRFVRPDGAIRPFEVLGDPGVVELDPRWHQAAFRFVELGFFHILDGLDHLLFLLCLVIPFRRVRPLVLVVTAFTIGHSITLAGAALGLVPDALWFPPLVETLIAASIVYMALENIFGGRTDRRWTITLGFGLVHGLGFSFALGETMQFAGSHLFSSLVAFNLGVELGQVAVLAILVPLLALLYRWIEGERTVAIVLSAIIAHTAWHWMTERFEVLRQYSFPALDAALFALLLRWLTALVFMAGLIWLASVLRRQRGASAAPERAGSGELPD